MIRAALLGFGLSLLIVGSAFAQARSIYDWRSGNMYTVTPGFGGGATVNGFNAQTGSMWHTQIDPHGNMNGFDSQMNPWSYNAGSGMYMNYGTGRTCIGQGYARNCF